MYDVLFLIKIDLHFNPPKPMSREIIHTTSKKAVSLLFILKETSKTMPG